MYSRTIKKSITIFLSCALLSAACLFSTAEAASFNAPTIVVGSGNPLRANKIYSGEKDYEYDQNGTLVASGTMTATYQLDVPIYMLIAGDGYINGYAYYPITFTATIDGGSLQIGSINSYFDSEIYNGLYISLSRTSASSLGSGCRINTVYQNFHPVTQTTANQYGLGTLHVIISGIVNTGNIAPDYINIVPSVGNAVYGLQINPTPSDVELAEIFKQAILNALEDTSLGTNDVSVAEYMNLYLQYLYNVSSDIGYFRTNYLSWLTELENDWLGVIIDNQDAAETLFSAINSNISAFQALVSGNEAQIINKLSNMENYLFQILHQGENATEGASEAQNAINQFESQVDVLDQPTVAVQDIFDPVDNAAADHGGDAANIFWWTWDSRITSIMYMVMAFGIIGFVIYGKSG